MARLPGIGEKTATRLVYWMLTAPEGTASDIGDALCNLANTVTECTVCCNVTTTDQVPCKLCARAQRDEHTILVVEHPQDVMAFERTGEFNGRYHVLHGALSPLDGVTPDALRIRSLLERLRGDTVNEVILATDPDVEGDATAMYIGRLLSSIGIKTTRLAHGISVGTQIGYADAVSLARALEFRREFLG
jgi:recombination protein RecR